MKPTQNKTEIKEREIEEGRDKRKAGEEGGSRRQNYCNALDLATVDGSTNHLRLPRYVKHCILFLSLPSKRLFKNAKLYNFQMCLYIYLWI